MFWFEILSDEIHEIQLVLDPSLWLTFVSIGTA